MRQKDYSLPFSGTTRWYAVYINTPTVVVTESLCFSYRNLDFICRKLKLDGKIKDMWFFNGRLFVIDASGNKLQIMHRSDLVALFGSEVVDSYVSKSR